jgi:hypothetical protein
MTANAEAQFSCAARLVVKASSRNVKTAVPRLFLAATRIEWETMAEQWFSATNHGFCAVSHGFSKTVQLYSAANRIIGTATASHQHTLCRPPLNLALQAARVAATGVEATLMTLMPSATTASAVKVADGIALDCHLADSPGLNMHMICGYAAVVGAILSVYTQSGYINAAVDSASLE